MEAVNRSLKTALEVELPAVALVATARTIVDMEAATGNKTAIERTVKCGYYITKKREILGQYS